MTPADSLNKNRDFLRYWSAGAVSELGTALSLIAFPLLVLALGDNLAQAGAVATCSLVTRLVLRLPGGLLADRWNRRTLMLAGDAIRMLALASIPVASGLGHLTYPQLLVVAIVEGAATALLFAPASGIAFRDVVAKEHLAEAMSRTQATEGVIAMAGPALGGAFFAVDKILPFTLDSISYAVSAALLLSLRTKPPVSTAKPAADTRGWSAGLRWMRRQPALLRALFFGTVVNVAGTAAEVGVVISLRSAGSGATVIGVVMACAGVGAVIGALLAPRIIGRIRPGASFAVAGVIWTAGLAAIAATRAPWVVGLALVVMIGITPVGNIALGSALVGGTPRELLGRVNTAAGTLTGGVASFGPLMAGLLLQAFSPLTAWLVLAVLCGLGTAVFAGPLLRLTELVAVPAGQEA